MGREEAAPRPGQDYKLELGKSFLGKRNADEYCAFRYNFKPESAGTSGKGVFQMNKASKNVRGALITWHGKPSSCIPGPHDRCVPSPPMICLPAVVTKPNNPRCAGRREAPERQGQAAAVLLPGLLPTEQEGRQGGGGLHRHLRPRHGGLSPGGHLRDSRPQVSTNLMLLPATLIILMRSGGRGEGEEGGLKEGVSPGAARGPSETTLPPAAALCQGLEERRAHAGAHCPEPGG